MANEHEFDVIRDSTEYEEPPDAPRPIGVWIVVAVLVIAAGIAAYFALGNARQTETPQAESAPVEEPAAEPLGTETALVEIPPLDESDPVVRDLVRKLSSHPQVLAWLATDGLIRNGAVVVSNIAEGLTPSNHVQVLKPSTPFAVVEQSEYLFVDPKSYERYNPLADAVSGIDPQGAARLYTNLKPRLQEAHAELGFPDTPFDRTLEGAIVQLLATPIPSESLRVEPKGIVYGYADQRLESLSGAQKQLLRMGPRNARLVQDSLRRIALALGIPESRLPRPR
jgi:hypothetical protein